MSDGLRILRVATDAYPHILGGGAIHVHEMSKAQAEMGHDVTLLTSDHGDRSAPREERRDGYWIRRYRQVARPFGNSITPGMLAEISLLAPNCDVIHAHSHLYFTTNATAALARVIETPLVVTNHGLHSQTAPKWVMEPFLWTVGRFTFNAADRVLCYTETDRERLRERNITAEISTINNGIDCETFEPTADRRDDTQVLFVGRFNESKGVHRLVEAFAGLTETFPDATLKLVGSGPLEDRLHALVSEHGITDCVEFTGTVPNEELPAVYANSTVFVLPSDAEGLPRTVLEAMACETPVVTSDLPQLEPVVDGAGLTVPRGSIDELRTSLADLLRDPDRRAEMGRLGRERVVAEYSWAATVRETTDVYREILDSPPVESYSHERFQTVDTET